MLADARCSPVLSACIFENQNQIGNEIEAMEDLSEDESPFIFDGGTRKRQKIHISVDYASLLHDVSSMQIETIYGKVDSFSPGLSG